MQTCPACDGFNPVVARVCVHCDRELSPRSRLAARLTMLLGPAGAILLAACYGAPGRFYGTQRPMGPSGSWRVDDDQDGSFGPWTCGPHGDPDCERAIRAAAPPPDVDCDDHDPTRYPGAEDPDGDGIDQNCDGVDGVAPPGAAHVEPTETRGYAQPPPSSSPPAKVAVPPDTP